MSQDNVAESLLLFCEALENAIAVLKQDLKKSGFHANEDQFNLLVWDLSSGPKLGEYEIAYKDRNQPDAFLKAFNTLKNVKADINHHYDPEGFTYYYWLYPEKYDNKIFRKRHKPAEPKKEATP